MHTCVKIYDYRESPGRKNTELFTLVTAGGGGVNKKNLCTRNDNSKKLEAP